MDYKEKVIALLNSQELSKEQKEKLEKIFPELKESEDERIIKELIEYIKDQQSSFISAPDCRDKYEEEENNKYNSWIAWLENAQYAIAHAKREGFQLGYKAGIEKQGEKIEPIEDFDTEFERQISHLIASIINKEYSYTEAFVKWTSNALLNYAKHEIEKQDSQIPANSAKTCKDEQKPIKEHDVCDTCDEKASCVNPCPTKLIDEQKPAEWHREDEQNLNACLGYIPDEFLRRWLMDVIHAKYDKPADKVDQYSLPVSDNSSLPTFDESIYHPCTEEVHEQKLATWSEEDEKQARQIERIVHDDGCTQKLQKQIADWLKSLKDRVQPQPKWSEDDELHIRELESLVKRVWAIAEHEGDEETIHKMSDLSFFLKTLKPQLKQEWSEEDNAMLINIENILIGRGHSFHDKEINWLKSLRPQSQWKPSERQLECLGYVIEKAEKDWSPLTNNRIYLTLKALKEQLEKLQ